MNSTETQAPDRVKLPLLYDVKKLQSEVEAIKKTDFIYYNAIPLRSPAHLVDSSVPFPPPATDYADGTWCDWLNTPVLEQLPYIKSILEELQKNTQVNLVRLLRLAPNSEVKEHTDPTLALEEHKSMIRLTIPIFSNDEVEFYLNNSIVEMKLGECWYLRLSDPHKIFNNSTEERINLTIDVIPNEWIKNLIFS